MLEEKMLHAAEKLLHATADANKMQALNQVEAANKRLKILRIELERHVGFLSSTSGNPDEVTAQTPVAQSMGTTPSLSMLVSTESSTALAECAHLTHEQLDEVEQYRQELEDQIEIEMKKRDLLVKGSNTIFEKKKSTKDIDMEIAMCDRLLHRWKDEIKIIVTGDADKIASLYHRVIQKNECNGHWFKVKQYECPTDCSYCHEPLWGAKSEGLECTVCKAICHKACKNLISVSCQDILELQNIPPMYFMANDPQEKARWVAGLTHLRNECEDENSGGQAGHSDTPLRSGAGSLSSLVMLYDKMAKDNISSNAKPLAGARSGSGYLLSTAAGSATPTAGYDSPKTPGTPTTLSRMGSVLSTSGREKSKSQTIWGRG
ncbi:uncharacterized protein BJ171DRAFT_6633 [Polychytrium aggregatum]|uniref:uncharacterized protein n=1 Tax=Polychytrium aggregatum TaxID=110093 RepID=UPI0022FF203D|nr:uncharacterized protein BJ171DRAFT_6633 [Polychytrium aggregatum]KAI9209732.1 hypothetical protein BJ171DRAFT_6633 [Polychytrium aggregatum]